MALLDTTIRDFGGGWNVADSAINLESRYQPVSENVRRGLDGSLSVRYGFALYADLRMGTVTPFGPVALSMATTSGQPFITVTWVGHGKTTGQHITISTISGGTLGGIPTTDIIGTQSIIVISANLFKFCTRTTASSTVAESRTVTGSFDTHVLAGDIIHMHYFNRALIVWDRNGEIAKVDSNGVATRIWSYAHAEALQPGLISTRESDFVSSTTFKSTLISCNGYDKDKPLQINREFKVEYLVDKATSSNAAVPRADYVIGMHGYVIFVRLDQAGAGVSGSFTGDAFLSISAKGTDGTFAGDPNPADATRIDLSMITDTVEPVLLGCGALRDKLYVGFYDKGMLGTLSIYSGTTTFVHTPDFEDTIAEHGLIAHRTVVSLGNDIFMTDYAGVPSVSISAQSGVFVPTRLSDLISPALSKHLSSLGEDTLRKKAFAIYNKSEREYMLFVPKYDETVRTLPRDPFYFNNGLREKNLAYVHHPSHNLIDRSYVTISGATAIGSLTAAMINGKRKIVAIADDDAYIIQLDNPLIESNITNGGGSAVSLIPVNDETVCYVYEYNKDLKIRRWTRYRDLDFDCGAVSQRGAIFLAKKGRIYQFGTKDAHFHADFVNTYDNPSWAVSTAYAVGIRVKDTTDKIVYVCNVAHTSAATGTFFDYREAHPDYWSEYQGKPILWEAETPWSDFAKRGQEKHLVYVSFDTHGTSQFDVSVFTNLIRVDPNTYLITPARTMGMTAYGNQITGPNVNAGMLIPPRTMQFTGGDAGGWGIRAAPSWQSGRRTREDRVWPMDVRGKLIRFRYSGASTEPFTLVSHTMYYFTGSVRR